mmetsp:Transcript_33626/g.46937  ORF Transcript_33626/g.46937 Transcript_33626/m.46937 type:complete len:214 (+) Transcript_33626:531-1172(+)
MMGRPAADEHASDIGLAMLGIHAHLQMFRLQSHFESSHKAASIGNEIQLGFFHGRPFLSRHLDTPLTILRGEFCHLPHSASRLVYHEQTLREGLVSRVVGVDLPIDIYLLENVVVARRELRLQARQTPQVEGTLVQQQEVLTLEGMDMRITNDVTTRSRGGGGGKVASRGGAGGGFAQPDGAQGARARIYDLQLLDVGRQLRNVSDIDETGAL